MDLQDNEGKKRLLVVDDDIANLTLAQKILGKEYKVAAVKSGAMVMQYLAKNMPALILLDINMPEMDGYEVIARLKSDENYKAIPVIFLTADNDAETETKCLQAGAVDIVTKPFIPDNLLARVSQALESNVI